MTEPPKVVYLKQPNVPVPFREPSKKARAFRRYLEGGERNEMIDDIRALGVTWHTARSWLTSFRLYMAGWRAGRQSKN